MWKIYEEQKIDDFLNHHLLKLLGFVYNHIITEASGSLISEYAKRQSSWEKLKSTSYSEDLIKTLDSYLISEDEKIKEKEKEIDTMVWKILFSLLVIQKMGIKFWDGFRYFIDIKSLMALIGQLHLT
ncbi:MAG: hypothetical protein IPJ31_12995 [Bacteroidetes bacterium]|nr:hypothetical protein [Bacteroidota bacterium]